MAVPGSADGLAKRVAELELENAELERELERLRGELGVTRSALPEIEDLHGQLKRLRADYSTRTDALQLLIAAAAREIGERTGVGPPQIPASAPTPVSTPVRDERAVPGPQPADVDAATTDELEAVGAELDPPPAARPTSERSEDVSPAPVWHPGVAEPVRGDWAPGPPAGAERA